MRTGPHVYLRYIWDGGEIGTQIAPFPKNPSLYPGLFSLSCRKMEFLIRIPSSKEKKKILPSRPLLPILPLPPPASNSLPPLKKKKESKPKTKVKEKAKKK